MADVFDIDSGGYHSHQKSSDEYNNRGSGGWVPIESNNSTRKDPRLARRDDARKQSSPQRMSKSSAQMYQPPPPQTYSQAPPPPPMYSEYNSGYGSAATSYQHQHNYQQSYQQAQNSNNFNQYNQHQQGSYQQQQQQQQAYNSGQHQQPGPPGEEYPGSWAPVPPAYPPMSHPPPPPVPRPSSVASTAQSIESKTDDLKKEAAIAQELKQQRATLIKQRDEYLRKASVLRRELDKLRTQKHELLSEKSPPRDSQRILRENAKLQLEIQNKLKSINNVVDMLSGIIGDGLKAADEESKATNSSESSPKRSRKGHSDSGEDGGGQSSRGARAPSQSEREKRNAEGDWPRYNYIHYDPELHWCRVCDVFPRSAKDLLNHLHSAEHRQVTQEHQLVDTPWHKLPTDPELPSHKGAPVKRVPIKGLQFFISATAWYCKLCDVWIGDLHCASLHLKSKNHTHNYSNFVEQNPHWETNWLKDREKAYARCAKNKIDTESGVVPPAPEPPVINEKLKRKKKEKPEGPFLDGSKEKKRKKKSKKRKKMDSSGSSSSSSSSSNSSTEDESDKAKSIRVAMRNKMRMQAQLILNEEIGGKLEVLGRLVEEGRNRKKEVEEPPPPPPESAVEDNIINQWMTVSTNNDKHILENLKGRLKQRQEADKEKAIEAAAEQRRREREREERELKEMREREQREIEEKMREEHEREERDREERERIKERERSRRKRRSDSRSPERYSRGRSRGRSRSRSVGRRRFGRGGRSPERYYRNDRRNEGGRHSPDDKFKPKRNDYEDEESQFDKNSSESFKKGKRSSAPSSSSRKLPFIGRMPLFKKKSDGEEKEIKKEDYEIRLSKFEPGNTARAFIPEPGVVHITKLATPPDQNPVLFRINAENPPPPPKIIPEPPQISETAPPPPMINDVVTTAVEETGMEVQDMELDEAAPPLPPGVPVAEAKPLVKPAGNHLPRDFQDALNIIFPGDQRPEHLAAVQNDPSLMMQYQYGMGYGMMYPGMQMYDYSSVSQEETLTKDESTAEGEVVAEKVEPTPPVVDDKEDLAMLGIDAEDMAAQTF